MRHMRAVINITLPDDEFEEAEAKLKVRPIWDAFLAALTEAQMVYTAKRETTWARTGPATTAAPKKPGPKPRAVPHIDMPGAPTIGQLADGEAA